MDRRKNMKKKKLIRLTTHDISLEGLLKGQLKYLSEFYDVVGVAADTGVLHRVEEREGVRTVAVDMHREIAPWADLKSLWQLYRLFRKEKPDVVHANTPKGSLLAMVAGMVARVPVRIYTVTGLRYQGAAGKFRKLLQWMERITCGCATHVIPEGNGVKMALMEDGITKKQLDVVLNGNINGVDTCLFAPDAKMKSRGEMRKELGLAEDDFVFIFIGRVVRDKGMNELAEVMRRLGKACRLILVGNFESELDPLAEGNEAYFKSSEMVRYVGKQGDVRPYLNAADALVFPSYREGFPNVVLEAGAMGLPAIVTDINGCNEIVKEGENGVIIGPRSVEELERAMREFVGHRERVKAYSEKAREMVVERYDRGAVWEALRERYERIMAKK